MLQNVWHAGIIWRVGFESNGEYIVRIVTGDVEIFGASLVVLELQCCELKLRDLLDSLQCKAMDLLPNLRIIGQLGDGSVSATRRGGHPQRSEGAACP